MRLLVATLWVGSLWTVGYLVAPTLFATLSDRALAGTIAGSVFRVEAWLSLACATTLLLLLLRNVAASGPAGMRTAGARAGKTGDGTQEEAAGTAARWLAYWSPLRLVIAMALCTLLGYFGLQPFMAAIREAAAGRELAGDARLHFGLLHAAASVIYLLQSLLGAGLVLKLR